MGRFIAIRRKSRPSPTTLLRYNSDITETYANIVVTDEPIKKWRAFRQSLWAWDLQWALGVGCVMALLGIVLDWHSLYVRVSTWGVWIFATPGILLTLWRYRETLRLIDGTIYGEIIKRLSVFEFKMPYRITLLGTVFVAASWTAAAALPSSALNSDIAAALYFASMSWHFGAVISCHKLRKDHRANYELGKDNQEHYGKHLEQWPEHLRYVETSSAEEQNPAGADQSRMT